MKLKRLFSSILLISLLSAPIAEASFSDVDSTHHNFQGISYLELQGGIDGAEFFRPDDLINKAELFKIMFTVFGETGEGLTPSVTFMDVPVDAWFAPYIELALRYDIISSSYSSFYPGNRVSKVTALKYLMKAYGIPTPIVPVSKRVPLYYDVSTKHPRYSIISKAVELGIFDSSINKTFSAYSNLTRGDFADMVFEFEQWTTGQSTESIEEIQGIHKSEIFADVWLRILENYYLPEGMEIDEEVLFQAAIKGLVDSLNDPFSNYIPPSQADSFVTHLTGDFQGIGVYLLQDDITNKIYITDFVPGSNAEEIGIQVGDVVEEVDGVNITKMSLEEVTSRIKGPAGTTVKIQIRRENSPLSFTIERRELSIISETGEIVENDIWFIDINSFTNEGFITVNEILVDLSSQVAEPRAVVFDLRGNGGGYIHSALSIAGHFVPNSVDLVQLDYGSFITTTANNGKGEYSDFQVYVLVDEFSASASEIMAAALQEQVGAIIVGTQTFGKGTAQQITQYWDGSILKLTIAQWLTSEGNTIQGVGLTPDIEVTNYSSSIDLWMNEVLNDLN